MPPLEPSDLHRQWFGQGTAPPIVLLHEGLGSVSTWGRFPGQLAQRCGRPVLAYDRPGYGRSRANPPPWSPTFMHDEAILLEQLVGDEGLEEVILVGHSDGATIALLAAAGLTQGCSPDSPTPIRGVVSLAAHLFVEPVCVEEIEKLRADQTESLISRLDPHHDRPADVFEGWSEVWVSERFRRFAIDDELSGVVCPVLAFQGTDDTYATRAQLERLEAAVNGPIELVDLPDCDHWPHREATQVVLDRIAAFCDQIDTLPA